MRRVAITGLGAICALGNNVAAIWEALRSGRSGIGQIGQLDTTTLRFHRGAEIGSYRPEDYFPGSESDYLDRFAQFGVIAAREALRDSQIELTPELAARTAVLMGSCVGGQATEDDGFRDLYKLAKNRVHPLTIPKTMANAGASHICMDLGITGPAITVSTACSSANHAIGQAYWWVRSGAVDMAIAGGSEAPFSLGILKAWEAMRVISADTCRPFSRDRSGMVLGEGGAVLMLEAMDAARARGAKIHAEITGFGMSADAFHLTQPSVDGPVCAIRAALRDGEIDAAEVHYVNAHGTGTQVNDPIEAKAIQQVFGDRTPEVLVSSTKSMHGHALGAAGALEAVATVLAMEHSIVPPTANFTEIEPQCQQLNVVANQARETKIACALSNSFAFGGLNAVLAFRRI